LLQKLIILLNKSHFILLCAFTETATEHYATIWSICVLQGSALTQRR